jgi:hypothetical protein
MDTVSPYYRDIHHSQPKFLIDHQPCGLIFHKETSYSVGLLIGSLNMTLQLFELLTRCSFIKLYYLFSGELIIDFNLKCNATCPATQFACAVGYLSASEWKRR